MDKEYGRIVNVETGVINTVKKERAEALIKSGEYQSYPWEEEKEEPKKKPAGRPKKEA